MPGPLRENPRRSRIASSPISKAFRPASVYATAPAGPAPITASDQPCHGPGRATARSRRPSARGSPTGLPLARLTEPKTRYDTPARASADRRGPTRPTCRGGWRSSPASRGRRSRAAACGPAPRRPPRACGCRAWRRNSTSADSSTTTAPSTPMTPCTHSGADTAVPSLPCRPISDSICLSTYRWVSLALPLCPKRPTSRAPTARTAAAPITKIARAAPQAARHVADHELVADAPGQHDRSTHDHQPDRRGQVEILGQEGDPGEPRDHQPPDEASATRRPGAVDAVPPPSPRATRRTPGSGRPGWSGRRRRPPAGRSTRASPTRS